MHPVSMAVSVRRRGRGEPGGQPWEPMLQYGDGSVVEVVADQRQVKSQPCGRRSARLIRAATMPGSHGEMRPAAARAAQALVSVSVSFTPVRGRSPEFARMVFVQFADGGGRQ